MSPRKLGGFANVLLAVALACLALIGIAATVLAVEQIVEAMV